MKKCPFGLALTGFIVTSAALAPLVLSALCFAGFLTGLRLGLILAAVAAGISTTGIAISAVALDRVLDRGGEGTAWAMAGLCAGVAYCAMALTLTMRL